MKRAQEIEEKLRHPPPDDNSSGHTKIIDALEEDYGEWKLKSSVNDKHFTVNGKSADVQTTLIKLIQIMACEESTQNIKIAFNEELEELQKKRQRVAEIIKLKQQRVIFIRKVMTAGISSSLEVHDGHKNCYILSTATSNNKAKYCSIFEALPQIRPASSCITSLNEQQEVSLSEEQSEMRVLLRQEEIALLNDIDNEITLFDNSLDYVLKRRLRLCVEIKNGELRMMTMFRELKVLKTMEGNKLLGRRRSCQEKANKIRKAIVGQKAMLKEKSKTISLWLEKEKKYEKEFSVLVPETHINYYDALRKIYMRKESCGNAFIDYEDEAFEDEDDDSSWESDGDGVDARPEKCSEEIYNSILDLREKRQNHAKKFQLLQREIGILNRNHEKLIGREKQIDRENKEINVTVREFQEKKQRAMNNISSFVTLSTKQISLWHLSHDGAGSDNCVIFSKRSLYKLYERIQSLRHEIETDRKELKRIHSNRKHIDPVINQLKESLSVFRAKLKELQVFKFGQEVDIDKIQSREQSNLLSSRDEEMLSNIADREQADAQRNQILGLKRNLVSSQTYLKKLVAENTNILTKLAVLSENNRKLQHKKLHRKTRDVLKSEKLAEKMQYEERLHLENISKRQQNEIRSIKSEITSLTKRKKEKL